MENPASWGDLENTINDAIEQWEEHRDKPGASLPMTIANALRAEGLVSE
jgi:hypothetical protein